MQRPTITDLRVRTPHDAHVIFHAVSLDLLSMVSRRLDTEERRSISSGCVFVWEERGPNAEATGLGIERWTDSIRWGPSRVRDEFLYYHERTVTPSDRESTSDSESMTPPRAAPAHGFFRSNLNKQTYSVFVETPRGRRKWHLIAYFTQDSLDRLRTIDDFPQLASLNVPQGKYKTARNPRPKAHYHGFDAVPSTTGYLTTRTLPFQHLSHGPENPAIIGDGRSNGFGHQIVRHGGNRSRNMYNADDLAPLSYLQNIPPPRRHPLDEEALMSFTTSELLR